MSWESHPTLKILAFNCHQNSINHSRLTPIKKEELFLLSVHLSYVKYFYYLNGICLLVDRIYVLC